jgi:hypothetical protein
MSQELKINRGVELMLRREKKAHEPKGLKFNHTIALLGKKFNFKFEFSWETNSN